MPSDFRLPPLPDLPIAAALPALRAALAAHARVVLEAPPGAGKTTVVPLALLAAEAGAARPIPFPLRFACPTFRFPL